VSGYAYHYCSQCGSAQKRGHAPYTCKRCGHIDAHARSPQPSNDRFDSRPVAVAGGGYRILPTTQD